MDAGARAPAARALGGGVLAVVALVLVSATLRAPITSVGPLIDDIRADLGLSGAAVGLLTTLPLVMFGLIAPVAPRLAFRWGIEWTLLGALVAITVGVAVRYVASFGPLLLGTIVAGAGIAVGNVLVPAALKLRFPRGAAVMMGVYSVALTASAALASGLAVPLADALGDWTWSLAVWAVLPLLAAVVWATQLPARSSERTAGTRPAPIRLWRDRVAWLVTMAIGLEALTFYSVVAWMPSVYRDEGLSEAAAGGLLSLLLFVGIPSGFIASYAASRLRDQRPVGIVFGGSALLSFVLLLVAPTFALPFVPVALGFTTGGAFSLGLTLLVLRAHDSAHAAALSGMAQAAGYLLAAVGPIVVGALHDMTDAWTLPLVVLVVLHAGSVFALVGACRPRFVGAGEVPAGTL